MLIIPSRVIHFNEQTGTIDNHWATLKNIFEQADQCLIIDDPFTGLLDQIHSGAADQGMASYLLSKLPVSAGEDRDAAARNLLSHSFAVFRAAKQGQQEWIDSRIEAALAAKNAQDEEGEQGWLDLVSGSTGVSAQVLREILGLIDEGALDGDARHIAMTLLDWLAKSPERLLDLVRPENLEGLFGQEYKRLKTDGERGAHAVPALVELLPFWMDGKPLCEIEKNFLKRENVGLCKYARHFSLRVVPDLAFIAGLPAMILSAKWHAERAEGDEPVIPTVLATMQAIIREGCDSPESLATRINSGRTVSRVASRAHYEAIKQYAPPGSPTETFDATKERMRHADIAFTFAQA